MSSWVGKRVVRSSLHNGRVWKILREEKKLSSNTPLIVESETPKTIRIVGLNKVNWNKYCFSLVNMPPVKKRLEDYL